MNPRARLDEERTTTLARIADMTAERDALAAASAGSNSDDEHDPEGTTIAFEREQFASLLARAKQHLVEIQAAIGLLANGSYGQCERCGEPIAEARLEALPATRRCRACAATVE